MLNSVRSLPVDNDFFIAVYFKRCVEEKEDVLKRKAG
jgi:hypothetical protein